MGILDKLKETPVLKKGNKKNLDYLLIFIVLVIVALLYLSTFSSQPSNNASISASSKVDTTTSTQSVSTDLEGRLKAVLSKIEGAGNVEVMITYETGTEIVPAVSVEETTNTSTDTATGSSGSTETKSTSTKPVTVQNSGSSTALVLVEKEPVVKGVIVVAEGANDIKTKLALQRAVQTVLNIDSTNIDIFTMEK